MWEEKISFEAKNLRPWIGTKKMTSLASNKKRVGAKNDLNRGNKKTIEKSSANLLKQTKTTYQAIAQKEIEIEDQSNEISRVRIDNLNCVQ